MIQPLVRTPFGRRLTFSAAAFLTTALTPFTAYAQDATWLGVGNNYNSNGNWTPAGVPTNIASFGATGNNAPIIISPTTHNLIRYLSNAQSYTIRNLGTLTLNGIGGIGIDNQSLQIQEIANETTMTLNNASVVSTGGGAIVLRNRGTIGGTAVLTLNGNTQLSNAVNFIADGGAVTAVGASVIGGSATTDFNNTSGANGGFLIQSGGAGLATGTGGTTTAVGGSSTINFRDTSHADSAIIFNTGGAGVAVVSDSNATGVGGVAAINFRNGSHADGSTFTLGDGGSTAVAGFDGRTATSVGGITQVIFFDTSHADNATFANTGNSTTAVGGAGRPGTPSGTAATGGEALAIGGTATLVFGDNAHANGATITNSAQATNAVGGVGGVGDVGVGGTGGRAQAIGSSVALSIASNAQVNNAAISNTASSATATGGTGGNGGAANVGGTGGLATSSGIQTAMLIAGNASVNGSVINNTGGAAFATGGTGGLGLGGAGPGGQGGDSTATGGTALLTITDNVVLGAGTQINNKAGDATSTGGRGGNAGSVGGGGSGGDSSAIGGNATVNFTGNASAGSATIVNSGGATTSTGGAGGNGTAAPGGGGGFASAVQGQATITFRGTSTAGAANITNNIAPDPVLATGADGTGAQGGDGNLAGASFRQSTIELVDSATGGSARITNNGGFVSFRNNSVFGTAAGGGARLDNINGTVGFDDSASAGNAAIFSSGLTASVNFNTNSTLGTGTLTNSAGAISNFSGNASLGTGTLTLNNGGSAGFFGNSDARSGRIVDNAGGLLTVGVNGLRIGSLTGAGNVQLNANSVQVGYLDLNDTFGGVIAGNGATGLVKRGTGTLALTGANTYTGDTVVAAGILQIGNGGTTGSVAGNINVAGGANIAFNRSNSIGYAGVISGAGTLTKLGSGTLVLTGANTYTGLTTINEGIVSVGANGTTGSIVSDVLVNANAAIGFVRSNNLSYGGVISGAGGLIKDGVGVLVLTGANTYTGGSVVAAGTLQIGNAGTTGSIAGNVSVSSGAALVFNRTDTITFAGNISGAGQLTKLAPGTLILTGNDTRTGVTLVSQGVLQIGNGGTAGSITGNILNNANVTFNRSDTVSYGGVMSGAGGVLTQAGSGTLVLAGANTYTGGTLVNNGTLELNGSVASLVTIATPGRLTGVGTVNSGITANGTVAPGNATSPFGTLTSSGAATFNAGSFLQPTINSAGQSSLLSAGSLVINGGSVRPSAVSGGLFLLQTDFRIAVGSGGRTGTFGATVDESLLPSFLDASLSYTGTEVFLRIRRNTTTFAQTAGGTPNQAAIGGALDAAITANNPAVFSTYLGTYNTLLPLSGTALQAALDTLSGDALTAFPVAAQEHASRFAERLNAYTWSNSSNVWGLIAYGDQSADSDGNGPGFSANGIEFQMGFNTSLGHDTRLGLSVGMNNGDVSIGDRLTTGNVDTWSVGAQLRHDFSQLYVSGQFTYSWHSIDSSRSLLQGGNATADYDANSWTAGGELGWVIRSGQLSIEPHLSVRHANTSTDAYNEAGPVGVLNVAAADYETTRFGIGARLADRTPDAPVRFHALLRYERETGDDSSALDNALPGLPTYRVVGTELGDNIFSGEVGAEFRISNGLSLFASGGGHTRSNETSLQANAGLRIVF